LSLSIKYRTFNGKTISLSGKWKENERVRGFQYVNQMTTLRSKEFVSFAFKKRKKKVEERGFFYGELILLIDEVRL